jgi:multidrug efflux system outer membrane protein
MKARTPLLLAALLAGGCKLGPDYQRPKVDVAESWREIAATEQESLANTPWWELFQDPELVKLIQGALEGNKDLLIAVERIEEARAIYGFTRADLYPKVDAFASAGAVGVSQNGVPSLPSGIDNEDTIYTVGGRVFWELDFFGRVRRATEAELAQLYATEEARRAVVLTLVADVARAYVELRELDRLVDISHSTLESRIAYVSLARERFEGGITSELDLRQAEAEMHRTETLVHDFEGQQRQKEHEISSLLGRNPGSIVRGRSLEELSAPLQVPVGLPSALLDRRPDVREAEEQLASANARIGEAKALLYPNIALTGAYGWESSELGDLFDSPSQAWSISANLLQPIFNSGQNRRRVEVTESRQRQALYAYERSVLLAFREVEDSLVSLRQSGRRRGSEGGRVEAERKVLELAEARYRGGVADYLEVLDAQRSLLDAELSETGTRRDELVALIQLYKALGGGWPHAPEPQATPETASGTAAPAPTAPTSG